MDRDELDPARADRREGHDARLSLAKPSPWRLSAWLWSLLVLLGGLALVLSVHHQ